MHSISDTPNTMRWYTWNACSHSCTNTTKIAPAKEPHREPTPPTMSMTSIVMMSDVLNMSGLR